MGEVCNTHGRYEKCIQDCKIIVRKPEEWRPVWRHRCRW